MARTAALKETLASAYAGQALFASLHSADPGTTGAGEITGGTPAYARKALTWTGGASDGITDAGMVTFDVPAGTTITHVGIWSASTGGTYRDSVQVDATFASQGTLQITLKYTQS
jgi:hypothetical protein